MRNWCIQIKDKTLIPWERVSVCTDEWMSAMELASEASNAEKGYVRVVRANEQAYKRMAQYLTRRIHIISNQCAAMVRKCSVATSICALKDIFYYIHASLRGTTPSSTQFLLLSLLIFPSSSNFKKVGLVGIQRNPWRRTEGKNFCLQF